MDKMAEQTKMEGLDVNDKFKLWGGGKTHDDKKVFRVQALKDFNDVKAGDLGGYVESEENISFKPGDHSWVYDDSIVHGDGRVEKDSVVYKNTEVKDSRITNGSNVSHDSKIEHSRIDNSVVQGANTFYANIKDSGLSHDVIVKNSRVEGSEVQNGSEVYNSKMKDSTLVNDAKISKGADITNVRLDDEQLERQKVSDYDTANAIELSDEELSDLEDLADEMGMPF